MITFTLFFFIIYGYAGSFVNSLLITPVLKKKGSQGTTPSRGRDAILNSDKNTYTLSFQIVIYVWYIIGISFFMASHI